MVKKPYKRSKAGIQRVATKKTLTKREQNHSSSGASSWPGKDFIISLFRNMPLLESLWKSIRDNWMDLF